MGYVIVIAAAALLAALYYAGVLPVQQKRALSYIGTGSFQKRCFGASFTGCTGWIRRTLRVKESRSYSFRLSGHVQEGTVRAAVQKGSDPLLTLTADNPTATVFLEKGTVYRLEIRFQSASGDYQLEWD